MCLAVVAGLYVLQKIGGPAFPLTGIVEIVFNFGSQAHSSLVLAILVALVFELLLADLHLEFVRSAFFMYTSNPSGT